MVLRGGPTGSAADVSICGPCAADLIESGHARRLSAFSLTMMTKEPAEIRAVVSVACPVCDGLTPVEEMQKELRTIACQHCSRTFDVPRAAIHDAQNQCLMALGEA
jgi:hypothetical protein